MKYFEGFLATHKLLQLGKLMVKSSGLAITLNEILILASIGKDKKELKEVSRSTMIDKSTILRTLTALKGKEMVSKLKIESKTYYMLTSSALNFLETVQKDNNASLLKFKTKEKEAITKCTTSTIEVTEIFSKYMVEE